MSTLKGQYARVIQTPGYHLTSQFDLPQLRLRQSRRTDREFSPPLSLTSMIDMFSMLVVFLIINFSANGDVFFINKDLNLPKAQNSQPLQNFPLITITKNSVVFDKEQVGDNPLHLEETHQSLPKLKAILQKLRLDEQRRDPTVPFRGEVNIQADQDTPVIYIKRVMTTLIEEDWSGINFATRDQ